MGKLFMAVRGFLSVGVLIRRDIPKKRDSLPNNTTKSYIAIQRKESITHRHKLPAILQQHSIKLLVLIKPPYKNTECRQ